MDDRRFAMVLATLTIATILLIWFALAFSDTAVAVGGESTIAECLAMNRQAECRECCVGMGGRNGPCAKACAQHRNRHDVSYSGLPD